MLQNKVKKYTKVYKIYEARTMNTKTRGEEMIRCRGTSESDPCGCKLGASLQESGEKLEYSASNRQGMLNYDTPSLKFHCVKVL